MPTRKREEYVVEENPRGGPRTRITYTPAEHIDTAYVYRWFKIVEVYEATEGAWRETGRRLVAEPTVISCQLGPIPEGDDV